MGCLPVGWGSGYAIALRRRSEEEKQKQKPGPKPEILKLEGNWKDAIRKSLQKKRPDSAWPKTI
jgi:hypothetical protein